MREQYGEAVEAVILYGSVARGEARGRDSDVDLLVVLADDVDRAAYERRIRELAYDIELAEGIVLSLLVLSASEYHDGTPFHQQDRGDAERLRG